MADPGQTALILVQVYRAIWNRTTVACKVSCFICLPMSELAGGIMQPVLCLPRCAEVPCSSAEASLLLEHQATSPLI